MRFNKLRQEIPFLIKSEKWNEKCVFSLLLKVEVLNHAQHIEK